MGPRRTLFIEEDDTAILRSAYHPAWWHRLPQSANFWVRDCSLKRLFWDREDGMCDGDADVVIKSSRMYGYKPDFAPRDIEGTIVVGPHRRLQASKSELKKLTMS
jgi:hypothetical protein